MDHLTVTLTGGETLLHAVLESGVSLAHECGGKLACATCCVVISEGRNALSEPSVDELDMLDRAGATADGARLACQASGFGEVVLRIPQLEAPPGPGPLLPVSFTAEAARFLTEQLAKHPGSVGMRLAVAPAGCSGLRYRVDPVVGVRGDDAVFESAGLRVVVDPASLPFIHGTTMKLVQEGLAQRLRFDNPNARQSCGCGESFRT